LGGEVKAKGKEGRERKAELGKGKEGICAAVIFL